MRSSGDYDRILVNQGINEASGLSLSPNRRPDIIGVRHDGTIDLFEIPSKTDRPEVLLNRMQEVLDKLNARAGGGFLIPIR